MVEWVYFFCSLQLIVNNRNRKNTYFNAFEIMRFYFKTPFKKNDEDNKISPSAKEQIWRICIFIFTRKWRFTNSLTTIFCEKISTGHIFCKAGTSQRPLQSKSN